MGTLTSRILIGAGIAALGGIAAMAVVGADTTAPKPAGGPMVPSVAVTAAVIVDLRDEVSFSGEFRPYQQIELYAKVPGFVKSIGVDIGDQVQLGQKLAVLEIPNLDQDIEQAQADRQVASSKIERLEAQYLDAHGQYLRIQTVAHDNPTLLAQQDIDDAAAKDRGAAAALAEARSDHAAAQAALDRLLNTQSLCVITAPFAGVVTERYSDPGSFVRGGTSPSAPALPLVRLSQNNLIRLIFPVPEIMSAMITVGQQVTVHIGALDKDLHAPITRFTRSINAETRTMEVECDLENRDLAMIPGMFAIVSLSRKITKGAVAIPVEAVIRDKDQVSALVVDPGHHLIRRPITLGMETADAAQVTSGIAAGDLVVVGNQGSLREGMDVAPHLSRKADRP